MQRDGTINWRGVRTKKNQSLTRNWFLSLKLFGLCQTLISTSTPLGSSSFIRASTVLVLLE